MRGHQDLDSDFKYKEGDSAGHILHAETTDKILLFADNGRFYTLSGDKLPRGRGFGEPVSLMVDLPADCDIVKTDNRIRTGRIVFYRFLFRTFSRCAPSWVRNRIFNALSPRAPTADGTKMLPMLQLS